MEPIITNSARRHGIADVDMLHAYRNHVDAFNVDEGLIMLIGPDFVGRMLEVGVDIKGDTERIVHAMPARPKFLR